MNKYTFIQKLEHHWMQGKFLCVGLDTDLKKIPSHLQGEANPIFAFNKAIIDATAEFVCAFKPNSAYYEADPVGGATALHQTLEYLRKTYPDIPVIDDAKRADIGPTNEQYVASIFDSYGFDAVTIHPYLGQEAVQPFLDRKDKGIIILVRTSNSGAGEFQDLEVDGTKLYQRVAQQIAEKWNTNGNCCIVVGATYPEELAEVREIVGDMPILIPGVGAQGGDLEKTVKSGKDSRGWGIIINASRSVIYAGSGEDFAEKAREEAKRLHEAITKALLSSRT